MKLVPLGREVLPDLYELYRKIEIFDQVPIVTPWEEIVELADDPHLDLPSDGRLALVDHKAVGFCHVIHRPGESDHARAFLVGGVDLITVAGASGVLCFPGRWNGGRKYCARTHPAFLASSAPSLLTSKRTRSLFMSVMGSARFGTSPS